MKRVDELGFYNLGHNELAKKVGLSPNKMTALVWYLNLKDDPDCFKAVTIGKSTFQRYSQNAISKIMEAPENLAVDEIRRLYRANLKKQTASGA